MWSTRPSPPRLSTILFLASDKADYITGQVVGVNGG